MGEAIGPDEGRDHVRRQEVVATVGQRVLTADDTSALLSDVTVAAVRSLESKYAGVFEAVGDRAVLRAGSGWRDTAVDVRGSWVDEALSGDGAVEATSPRGTDETGLLAAHGGDIGPKPNDKGSWFTLPAHDGDND